MKNGHTTKYWTLVSSIKLKYSSNSGVWPLHGGLSVGGVRISHYKCLCLHSYSQCVGQKLTSYGAEWEHCHNKPNHLASACVIMYVSHLRWRQLARRDHVQPHRILRKQLRDYVTGHGGADVVAASGLVAPSSGKMTHRTNFHINCTVYILHFAIECRVISVEYVFFYRLMSSGPFLHTSTSTYQYTYR